MVKTKNQVPNISVLFYMFLLVFLQFDVVEAKFSCRPFRFKPPKMWRMDFGFPGEYILTMNGNPHVQRPEWTCFTIIHLDDNDTHISYFYHHTFHVKTVQCIFTVTKWWREWSVWNSLLERIGQTLKILEQKTKSHPTPLKFRSFG